MADYINNVSLSQSLGAWADAKRQAIATNSPVPRMPEDVAESAILIAEHMMERANFRRYSFKDDLIGTALLSVVRYAGSFDRAKSENGFSFVTQIIHNSVIRYIVQDARNSYIAAKLFFEAPGEKSENLVTSGNDIIARFDNRIEKVRVKNREREALKRARELQEQES